jgi:hypothetical protein
LDAWSEVLIVGLSWHSEIPSSHFLPYQKYLPCGFVITDDLGTEKLKHHHHIHILYLCFLSYLDLFNYMVVCCFTLPNVIFIFMNLQYSFIYF